MGDITLDRKTFEALAAESRISILKSLANRRKTQSELANELGLSIPTVAEHLRKMESAGLVRRIDENRKWIYYELTNKGRSIIKPKTSMRFVFVLSVSIILILAGIFYSPLFMRHVPYSAAGEEWEKPVKASVSEETPVGFTTNEQQANLQKESEQDRGIISAILISSGIILLVSSIAWHKKNAKF